MKYLLLSNENFIIERSETLRDGYIEITDECYEQTFKDGEHTFKYSEGAIECVPYELPPRDKAAENERINEAHAAQRAKLVAECEPQFQRYRNQIILQGHGEKTTEFMSEKQFVQTVKYQESLFIWQLGEPQPEKPEWMVKQ